jgi:S-formylglutathione hydrolase FrmB
MKVLLRSLVLLAWLATAPLLAGAQTAGASAVAVRARSRVECSTVRSTILARSVPYCVMLPPSYTQNLTRRYPVSYFLHGLGDTEQALANVAGWGVYDQLLAAGRVGELVMIAPFGYTSFYINSHDGRFRYEDFFLNEFLPAMERRYRIGSMGAQRGIMGVSMGGFGALHYAFKYPQKFAAVSATMPALMDRLPRELAEPILQSAMGAVFGDPLDPAFYERNSPFHLARAAPLEATGRMTIYFDCGAQDRYGFDRGLAELDKLLTRRGIAHEAHIYPGGHNWRFVEEHFDSALEAQSRGLRAR